MSNCTCVECMPDSQEPSYDELVEAVKEKQATITEQAAKIAELEAIIKASQEQEPVGYTFVVWDGRVRREHLAIDYMVQYDKVYGWEEIRGKTPLYAKPVIKEQP